MKSSNIIQFCATLESKLDTCLFRTPDDQDKEPSTAAEIAKGTATVVAGGAGYLAHRKIMRDYGGDASGSIIKGYRNAGRTAAQAVSQPAKAAVQAVGAEAKSAAARAAKSYRTAREVGGLGAVGAGVRAGKKAVNPALARIRGVLSRLG